MGRGLKSSPLKQPMTNRCVRCLKDFEENYKANVCNECSTVTPGFPTFKVGINDMRWLHRGTAWEGRMSKAEENEIGRQVAIPKGNGKFSIGRRMENGRIAEKPVGN